MTYLSPREVYRQDLYVTQENYQFRLQDDIRKISRSHSINWNLLKSLVSTNLLITIRFVIAQYAILHSPSHTQSIFNRFKHYCQWASRDDEVVQYVSAVSLANYRASLSKRNEWYVGVVAGLLRRWQELGYEGLGDGLIAMIDGWRLPGNKKGEAVQLQSVTQGALTDLEFEAYNTALISAFESGRVSIEDFVLVMLFAFSGRRPAQLADLKAMDLIEATANDGLTEYILNVPRRKQRGGSFRCSFKPFALSGDNGLALKTLIQHNSRKVGTFGATLDFDPAELPVFPNWRQFERFVTLDQAQRRLLPIDVLHVSSADLSGRIKGVSLVAPAISERTGQPIHMFPYRLRRTIGTRGAREGYGELMLAELLDHSDLQNVGVYTENVPEHIDAINRAVASQLAPIAQAFAGKLVDTESDAIRGDDPSSRIRSRNGKGTGTCGHFGFCGGPAPIACYTCHSFQPWLHGPHEEVLERLIADNERVARVTGDPQIINIPNRTILAVTRVIQLCAERKRGLC
jgi:integrase